MKKPNCLPFFMLILLAGLLMTGTVNAQKSVGPRGVFTPPSSVQCLSNDHVALDYTDMLHQHRKEMDELKQRLHLKDVQLKLAPDDFWFYAITGTDGLVGAIGQDGRIIVPPTYRTCHYCPIENGGQRDMNIYSPWGGGGLNASIWQHAARGSFLVSDGQQWRVFTLNGKQQNEFIVADGKVVLTRGFLFTGINPDDLVYTTTGGVTSLWTSDHNGTGRQVMLFTSDGKSVFDTPQQGFRIDYLPKQKRQVLINYAYNDGILCQGGRIIGDASAPALRPIYGEVNYDVDRSQWIIRQTALRNPETYNPEKHQKVGFLDNGERLFYQGKVEECIQFYRPYVERNDNSKPWASFYLAEAWHQQICGKGSQIASVVYAFENLGSNSYTQYYNQRNDYLEQINSLTAVYPTLLSLLNNYDSRDATRMFSESSAMLKKKLSEEQSLCQNYKKRLTDALATLDSRIAEKERREREWAAEMERQREREREAMVVAQQQYQQQYQQQAQWQASMGQAAWVGDAANTLNILGGHDFNRAGYSYKLGIENSSGGITPTGPTLRTLDAPLFEYEDINANTSSSSKKNSKSKSTSVVGESSCPECIKGECSMCHGDTFYQISHTSNATAKCPKCNIPGNTPGRCPRCKGSGSITRVMR